MRVYELAQTLDVPTDDLIDALEDEFAYDPGSHMASVEKDIIPDVMSIWSEGKLHKNGTKKMELPRSLFRLKIGDVINLSVDKKSIENRFDELRDQVQFWVGVLALIGAEEGSKEKNAVRRIGKDYLEQLDENTENGLRTINESSDKLYEQANELLNEGLELGLNQLNDLKTQVQEWTRNTVDELSNEFDRLRPRVSFNVELNWQ